jgi:hypothetical protein
MEGKVTTMVTVLPDEKEERQPQRRKRHLGTHHNFLISSFHVFTYGLFFFSSYMLHGVKDTAFFINSVKI